jgi:hypothetical protein
MKTYETLRKLKNTQPSKIRQVYGWDLVIGLIGNDSVQILSLLLLSQLTQKSSRIAQMVLNWEEKLTGRP